MNWTVLGLTGCINWLLLLQKAFHLRVSSDASYILEQMSRKGRIHYQLLREILSFKISLRKYKEHTSNNIILIFLSVTTDFLSLCAESISMPFFSNHTFIQYWLPLSAHILFGLRFDSSKTFWKALVILIPFLSFKGITHANLL